MHRLPAHTRLLLAAALLLAACGGLVAPAGPIRAQAAAPQHAARPPKPVPGYQPHFVAAGCPFASGAERVDCGYLIVPENRARPQGVSIKLAVAIIRSRAARPLPDPLLYLEGGPGGSTLYDPAFWYDSPFRARRDLILLDQRGTGYSLPSLNCPELEAPDLATFDDEVRAAGVCRRRLTGAGINIRQYTSAAIAADVADLRLALGLEQLNLLGVSYGTRAALTVLRDHPQGIRSVILDSAYPPQVDAYTEGAANAAAAIEVLLKGCAANPACARAYPDIDRTLPRLVGRLNRRPATIERKDADGQTYTEQLYGDDLVDDLVGWLYDTWLLPQLPHVIAATAAGDYAPLVALLDDPYAAGDAQAAPTDDRPAPPGAGRMDTSAAELGDVTDSEGLFYSVECREELPFGDLGAAARALDPYPHELHAALMASLEQTAAICAVWNAGRARAIEDQPVASAVPTLVLAGEYDPVTPPRWGAEAARQLSHSTLLVFPGTGHGVVFADRCAERIAAAFVERPDAPPDASCRSQVGAPAFELP